MVQISREFIALGLIFFLKSSWSVWVWLSTEIKKFPALDWTYIKVEQVEEERDEKELYPII